MPKIAPIPYEETRYGFVYGSLTIHRMFSDAKHGWVIVNLTTPKTNVQVYATKTGKVRVFVDGKEVTKVGGKA